MTFKASNIKLIILSGGILFLFWGILNFSLTQTLYNHLVQELSAFVAKFVEYMAGFYEKETSYNPKNQILSTSEVSFSIASSLALKFYLIAFIILIIKPSKPLQTSVYLIVAWALLFIISVARFSIDINNPSYKNFYLALIYTSRYLVLYLLIIYKINLHDKAKNLINKINLIITDKLELNLLNLLLFFILLKPILSFVDFILANQYYGLREHLTQLILWLASIMLKITGYSEAMVNGYQITMGNYWVYLGAPCLGLGVMLLFAGIIFVIKSNIVNKLLFIATGWTIIIVMNASRIVFILLYIFLKQLPQKEIKDFHNMSNNFFYLIILLLIIVYVRWFQNINFVRLKAEN